MKRILLSALLAVGAASAMASAFTPGDVVIYRVGDGTATLANTGNSIFLDEYTPGGALVQSINVSTDSNAANGANNLVASGTATSEGFLTISPNGQWISLTGYDTAPLGTSVVSSSAARSVVVYGRNGLLNSQSNFTDFGVGNNPRSAVTTDGVNLWMGGAAGGVRYATAGSTTSTQLSTTVTNIRQVNIFGGQLYNSDSSGSTIRLGMVGTGLPTTSGQTITNLPGFPVAGSPYSFFFADLNAGVSGLDTLYVSDDTASTGGIQKYSLVGGSWVLNNTIVGASVRGLTGVVNGSTVQLFGTDAGTASDMLALTDTAGYNANDNGSLSTVATAGANTAFRGIAYVPQAVPEPTTLAIVGIGLVAVLRRRTRLG